MEKARALASASALVGAVSLVFALFEFEGVMTVVSAVCLLSTCVLWGRDSAKTHGIILSAAALALVFTLVAVWLNGADFTEGDGPDTLWYLAMGLVHTAPIVPLTFVLFEVIASRTGASYNWAVVRGLTPFIAMGLEVPGFLLEYMFQSADNWLTDNGYILYNFLVTVVVMVVAGYLVSRRLRDDKIIITERGAEVRQC